MTILQFCNAKNNSVSAFGGKASSLINLTKNGFNVPNGFVISTNVFNNFLKYNGIKIKIDILVSKLIINDIKGMENISFEIQKIFSKAEIPSKTIERILKEFNALGTKYVAVRSSANVEDSSTNTWAGQFETYLNTTNAELIDNIKKCWQSLFLPKALMYRARNNMINKNISVAVIVQKMVDSQISGIGFSTDPVNNDMNNIIIEAGFGLGEAIVSGQIIPDTYTVDKRDLNIVKKVNYQSKAIYKSGIKTISKQDGYKQKLSDKQIIEVTNNIKKIEEIYKHPVDIEFAYNDTKFYLLQARPITTFIDSNCDTECKIDNNLIEYIKSQKWGAFKNTNRPLLFASMWVHGIRNPLKDVISEIEVEDIEVNTILNRPIRCFNLNKGSLAKKELLNLNIILDYIDDDYNTLKEAQNVIDLITSAMNSSNYEEVCSNSLRFISLYDKMSFYECYINGLLNVLYQNKKYYENVDIVLQISNKWRNDESIDNSSGIFIYVAQFLLNRKKINIPRELIVKYFHISEFIKMLKDELSDKEIIDIVERRKKHGYILLNLTDQNTVLDIKSETKVIEDYIYSVHLSITKQRFNGLELIGESTFRSDDYVRGECVVIYQEEDLSSEIDLANKILVTTMTTPNFIPYINGVKGIVTDNGGIICHAAIISREYRIPCIIGTEAATSIYKTGDFIEMNIKDGIIKKIL